MFSTQIDKVAQELEVWQSQTAEWKAAVLVEAQKERSRREAFDDLERVDVKVSFHKRDVQYLPPPSLSECKLFTHQQEREFRERERDFKRKQTHYLTSIAQLEDACYQAKMREAELRGEMERMKVDYLSQLQKMHQVSMQNWFSVQGF